MNMSYVYKGNFKEYVGKQVLVKYDGKQFQGNVEDTYNNGVQGNQGIIIEDNEGNFKHIKARRLDEPVQIIA